VIANPIRPSYRYLDGLAVFDSVVETVPPPEGYGYHLTRIAYVLTTPQTAIEKTFDQVGLNRKYLLRDFPFVRSIGMSMATSTESE
jgi:hypothetical protein